MRKMTKTSLLLLVYNGENYLNRALKSVYNQTTKLDEIVIIDDASKDKTSKIIDSWSEKLPIKKVFNKVNIGIFDSLKQGVDCCSGQLIFRIDHDDEWSDNHVAEILRMYYEDNKASVYATRANYYNHNRKFIGTSKSLTDKEIRKILLWDNPLVQSATAFIKKDFLKVYKKVNTYSLEDYDLWIKLLKNGRLKFSSKITVNYFIYATSLSRQNIKRNYKERFLYQFKAIRIFFFKYPIRSTVISLITIIRFFILKFLRL